LIQTLKLSVLVGCFFALFKVVEAVTEHKFHTLKQANSQQGLNVITAKDRERQLSCLAINIYREAANEPFEGKVGIAQVTLNRAKHPAFPKDICEVVYQKNTFMGQTVCQFSWYCNSQHRTRPVNQKMYDESYEVAKKVLLENFKLSSLDHAIYYHADYVNPRWNHVRLTKIGKHIFYKPKDNI